MLHQRLVIVAGKGGVGRTTVAAALGLALARAGRRTLLAHVRCRQQLSALLGAPGEIDEKVRKVDENLWAVNMSPRAAIREMGLLVLRFRSVYRLVLENRIVRSFLRAVPALEEYSMVGKAWHHTTERLDSGEPRYETVIFDGPATGHLISMLRIPQVILDAVPEGPLTGDAQKARALLSDPARTCIWLVTLAEEMAVSEALDLHQAASDELDIAVDRLVVNRLYPPELALQQEAPALSPSRDRLAPSADRPSSPELADAPIATGSMLSRLAPLATHPSPELVHPDARSMTVARALATLKDRPMSAELTALASAARTFQARRQINEVYLTQLAERLPMPTIELPHLFAPLIERPQLEILAERIAVAIAEGGADGCY